MAEAVLQLKDVKYSYPKGGFITVCNDLKLCRGEAVLLCGPNGSGKTTLGKLLCGILRPQQGSLFVCGENANGKSLGWIGKTVGYLFQDPARQLFATTVWEEMIFIDDIKGIDPALTRERALSLLSRFRIQHLTDRSTYRLSRGEKQRLAMCTILMQGATQLILDEPSTGLDNENRSTLRAVIDELITGGAGVLIITHDNELIRRYGAQLLRMEHGEVFC